MNRSRAPGGAAIERILGNANLSPREDVALPWLGDNLRLE
ncbi:hypothetical protein BW23_5307 [Burkholderia ubonensis MSMB22]|nr:hypothetical protein BW23_5307 [Burkholderia ubonensis MSMB22]